MFTGSRKRQPVLYACLTPPFQFPISSPWKGKYSGTSIFSSRFRTGTTCLRSPGEPSVCSSQAYHMEAWTQCQAEVQRGRVEGEGWCWSPVKLLVTATPVSSQGCLLVWEGTERHGPYCKLLAGHRTSCKYYLSFSSPFLLLGCPWIQCSWLRKDGSYLQPFVTSSPRSVLL